MFEIIKENQKDFLISFMAIIGTVIGITATMGGQYLSFRNKRIRDINRTISILLDALDAFTSYGTIQLIEHIENLPDSDEKKRSLKLLNEYVVNFITGVQAAKLERIKEIYQKEIAILAEYDPIIAFKLRDLQSTFDNVENGIKEAKKTIEQTGSVYKGIGKEKLYINESTKAEKIIRMQLVKLTFKWNFERIPNILLHLVNIEYMKIIGSEKNIENWKDWAKKNDCL